MSIRLNTLFLRLRNRHFLLIDAALLCLTPLLALMLRVDGLAAPLNYGQELLVYIPIAVALRLLVFYRFELYSRYWRYASVEELTQIISGVAMATALILAVFFLVRIPALGICDAVPAACGLPRSVPFIDGLLALLVVGGVRFSVRSAELWRYRSRVGEATRRVLIAGAGDAGALIVKEMRSNPQLGLDPMGFVDDDPLKRAVRIHAVPVLGNRQEIPRLVSEHQVDQVIIAMPTASGKTIREFVAICEAAGVPAKTMPGVYELLGGQVSVKQLRDVQIEDLLRREPIHTDVAAVQELIRGRRVLITGGGGSIGGELCRQVLRYGPAELVILGHGENSVFDLTQELQAQRLAPAACPVIPVIADVRFPERVQGIFQVHRPQIVFHAAAHKHVPLMEQNPAEAVSNNILGTRHVVAAALAARVERFVMISTDKAVNPTGIMGASKRTAELLVHQAAERSGQPYVAVRFGNVLGSRGSVVHTFQRQIAAGGPVTVTDPQMRRYFMTIPEAVQLVLQAAALGTGGEVFVLDMGEPVQIVDLARDLIELSGLEVGRDIDIVFTGLRPGEKLFEELFVDGERYERTRHEKIFLAANASAFVPSDLDKSIAGLARAAAHDDRDAILRALQALIPEYRPPGLPAGSSDATASRAVAATESASNGAALGPNYATAPRPTG